MQKIVIVGGGSCGWTTALFLSQKLKNKRFDITLVCSEELGILGVGESTVLPVKNFYNDLGISDEDFVQKMDATFKLSVRFDNWSTHHKHYYDPLGYGTSLAHKLYDGIPFYYVLKRYMSHLNFDEATHIYADAIRGNKGPYTQDFKPTMGYSYHFNAEKLAQFLKKSSIQDGVHYVNGKIVLVQKNKHGNIESLTLDSNIQISGDIFFDCSGFKSLLLGQQFDNTFIPYGEHLINDSAMVCRTERQIGETIMNYTNAKTMSFGWKWKIPLSSYDGHGYVYSSKFQNYEDIKQEFLDSLKGEKIITEIRDISFRTGRYEKSWTQNCIGLGGAYGFVEPLSSTAIYFFCHQLEQVLSCFKEASYSLNQITDDTRGIYNTHTGILSDNIRDMILFVYTLSGKQHNLYWQHYTQGVDFFPDTYQEKIQYLQSNFIGDVGSKDVFGGLNQSFTSIMAGNGFIGRDIMKIHLEKDVIKSFLYDLKKGQIYKNTVLNQLEMHTSIINNLLGE